MLLMSTEGKCEVLSQLWMDYRDHEDFADFIEFNDVGLPLAFAVQNGIVPVNDTLAALIDDTYSYLTSALEVGDDVAVDGLEGLFELAGRRYLVEDEDDIQDPWESGYESGVIAERQRVKDIVAMHMKWAEESRNGKDYMLWKGVGEVLTPVEITEYDEEEF
jgi:hypothetical protein